jgi:hypothetical protein
MLCHMAGTSSATQTSQSLPLTAHCLLPSDLLPVCAGEPLWVKSNIDKYHEEVRVIGKDGRL